MILTDTHTHIYYEADPEKLSLQLQKCRDQHITRLFLPNVDRQSVSQVLSLANEHPDFCYPMLGLHPCEVKENFLEELQLIKAAQAGRKIYAIGEIGIDLYWDKTFIKEQQEAFRLQILWAKEAGLPIVIHCREAFDEVFEVLEEQKDEQLRGIFHCFTGSLAQAHQAIDLGFMLGIGGVVTYKNAGLAEVVAQLSPDHLVLETDAPYLAPVPHRGKPNESAFLTFIAQKIADLQEVSLEEIAALTTANSRKVFGV